MADKGEPLTTRIPLLKSLSLFNVAQCDGLPESVAGVPTTLMTGDALSRVDAARQAQVMKAVEACGVRLCHRYQDRACYSPGHDRIVMPQARQFHTEADYWSTLLHEMTHATGHATRLNREGITASSRQFGDPVYAFEELVGELGSAFLCARLGVLGDVQHDSYLAHWLRILREDKRALFRAGKLAREASEYLLTPLACDPPESDGRPDDDMKETHDDP